MAGHSLRPMSVLAAALNADVYSKWISCTELDVISFQVGCVGTGSPVGTWKFEGTNDPAAVDEAERERHRAATAIGASTVCKTFALPTDYVVGSALAITGASATESYVSYTGGLPHYVRVWFDNTSGGSAASLGHAFVSGRRN